MFSGSKIYIFPHTSPLFSTFFQKNIEFLDNSSDFTLFKLENRYSIAYQSQSLLHHFDLTKITKQKAWNVKSSRLNHNKSQISNLKTSILKPQSSNHDTSILKPLISFICVINVKLKSEI